jgi:hypothetical protein
MRDCTGLAPDCLFRRRVPRKDVRPASGKSAPNMNVSCKASNVRRLPTQCHDMKGADLPRSSVLWWTLRDMATNPSSATLSDHPGLRPPLHTCRLHRHGAGRSVQWRCERWCCSSYRAALPTILCACTLPLKYVHTSHTERT